MTTAEQAFADQLGLRERGKARRRDAIVRAAYRLFAERGYDATTVSDIAAAAEVAPRTVALYFPSKQDIALARFTAAADALTTALHERDKDEPVVVALEKWLKHDDAHADDELRRLGCRMFAANSELNALRTARMADAIAEGAKAIAEETGLPPGDPGPRLAAVAAAAILIEISDLPRGPERDRTIATAMALLTAMTRALA
jgi:AcrR family transcriptional regulator